MSAIKPIGGPHQDWALSNEDAVREALERSDRDIKQVIDRHPESVQSSERFREGTHARESFERPDYKRVYVLTEYGIGDPFTYTHVYQAFEKAVEYLERSTGEEWMWDSINTGKQVFIMLDRETRRNPAARRGPAPRRRNPGEPRVVRGQEVVATLRKTDAMKHPREITGVDDVAPAILSFIGERSSECFVTIFVNVRNQIVGHIVFTQGSPAEVSVSTAGVFQAALSVNASAIITAHQHPTGSPTPSAEDIALWKRLDEAGKIIGIPTLDHLIVTSTQCYSRTANSTYAIARA